VLRECLLASDVERVFAPVRSKTQQSDPKLLEIIQADMMDISPIAPDLSTGDACFFCLGVSSAGMSEADYTRLTHDLTLSVARELAKVNPAMTFIYVSGQGTDASEKGRTMWARVKGKTENELLELPFKAAYMFRPGFIQPLHGIKSKTPIYRAIYSLTGFLAPLAKWVAPGSITDTEKVGKAMLAVARNGSPKKILETPDINQLGG
jgi:uncharacterized protein YbjT (DUF2867 family)